MHWAGRFPEAGEAGLLEIEDFINSMGPYPHPAQRLSNEVGAADMGFETMLKDGMPVLLNCSSVPVFSPFLPNVAR